MSFPCAPLENPWSDRQFGLVIWRPYRGYRNIWVCRGYRSIGVYRGYIGLKVKWLGGDNFSPWCVVSNGAMGYRDYH